jgi:hypothetical protein
MGYLPPAVYNTKLAIYIYIYTITVYSVSVGVELVLSLQGLDLKGKNA